MEKDSLKEIEDIISNIIENFGNKKVIEAERKAELKAKEKNDFKDFIDNKVLKNKTAFDEYYGLFEKIKLSSSDIKEKIKSLKKLIDEIDKMLAIRHGSTYREDYQFYWNLDSLKREAIEHELMLERQKDLNSDNSGFNENENKIKSKLSRDKIAVLSYYLKGANVFRGNLSDLDLFSAFAILTGYTNNGLKNSDSTIKNQTIKITEQEKQELLDLLDVLKNKIQKEITPSKSKFK